MSAPGYPALYQINARLWFTGLSRALVRRATLDDVPDAELDRLAAMGFDWVWLLSVRQTGEAARTISRANCEWRREFAETLPDLGDDDIGGSGCAVRSYAVHRELGGAAALVRLRKRLPFADLGNGQWRLQDVGDAAYEPDGEDLQARGLYLDESPCRAHLLSLTGCDDAHGSSEMRSRA